MTTMTIHGDSQFQKPSSLRWTWESPGGGYRYEIDHIIVNKRFCLTDIATTASRKGMKKIIYDFYSDLFNSHVHLRPHYMREDGHVIPKVLPPELRHTIMSVRNRTAPYPDRIRFEHPKNLPSVLISALARLFTRYLSKSKVPKQWKTSKTVLLYKKGDPHDIGNYRPICLLFYKLFTRLILNRIEKVLDEGQPCKQAEFRREFSKIDQIHTVSKLIEISREYKMPPLHYMP